MLTTTEVIKGTLGAATTTVKPLKIWGSTLKLFVLAHPVGFLTVTGGALVGLGAYYYATHQLKNKEHNPVLIVENSTPPVEEPELL